MILSIYNRKFPIEKIEVFYNLIQDIARKLEANVNVETLRDDNAIEEELVEIYRKEKVLLRFKITKIKLCRDVFCDPVEFHVEVI